MVLLTQSKPEGKPRLFEHRAPITGITALGDAVDVAEGVEVCDAVRVVDGVGVVLGVCVLVVDTVGVGDGDTPTGKGEDDIEGVTDGVADGKVAERHQTSW